MAYRVSTPENSIVDFRAGRTRYDYDSYFDTLDTEISELLTVPEISNLKIEAAKDFGGTGTGWAQILNSKGLSHFPRESRPGVIAEEISAYVPEGNPTDFSYGYAVGEHALFFVKTISPTREFAKYYWEVNGERKSDGPILTLYNLSDTGTDIQTVTCVAVDPRGRERRQSLTYICNSDIFGTEISAGENYREKGLGYLAPNLSVFYDTSLSEEQRQKPFQRVDSEDGRLRINGLVFTSWKEAIKKRERVRFKNAGIDENRFGEPDRILNDDDSLSGTFLEIYNNGWKSGKGGGKENNSKRMDGYSNNEHKERYPTPSAWLEAVFLGEIRPYWNVPTDAQSGYDYGIEIDWKD